MDATAEIAARSRGTLALLRALSDSLAPLAEAAAAVTSPGTACVAQAYADLAEGIPLGKEGRRITRAQNRMVASARRHPDHPVAALTLAEMCALIRELVAALDCWRELVAALALAALAKARRVLARLVRAEWRIPLLPNETNLRRPMAPRAPGCPGLA